MRSDVGAFRILKAEGRRQKRRARRRGAGSNLRPRVEALPQLRGRGAGRDFASNLGPRPSMPRRHTSALCLLPSALCLSRTLECALMKPVLVLALLVSAACSVPSPAKPQTQPPPQAQPAPAPAAPVTPAATIESKTAKLPLLDGFLPLYWDAENGKLLMRITHLGEELIYQTSLPAGVGSNTTGVR